MPITPINRTKNLITPDNKTKGSTTNGLYGFGVYGYAMYGVGTTGYGSYVNKDKSSSGAVTIEVGQPMGLLLAITYPTTFTSGNGWINKTKN